MERVRVLVVDGYTIFRQGLVKLLEGRGKVKVVGEAGSGQEAEARARELRPDVILMGLRISDQGVIQTTRHIVNELPATRVLFLSVSEDGADFAQAIKAGAHGYLLKTLSLEELEEAIVTVFRGYAVVSPPNMMTRLFTESTSSNGHHDYFAAPIYSNHTAGLASNRLTSREKEIFQLVSSGATNKEIAGRLYIAETTVKTHLKSILEKLHVHNRVELALLAAREGWFCEPT